MVEDCRIRGALSLVGPVVWSAYLMWRAPGWGWLAGVPLTPLATAFLFAIWWQWWLRGRLPFTAIVAGLTIAKIALSPLLVEHGLSATQFDNAHWTGPSEPGLYHSGPPGTRVDQRLAFGEAGEPDLPLFFQNDSARFNFPRTRMGYSIRWLGYWNVSQGNEPTAIYIKRGPLLTAVAEVDGAEVAALDTTGEEVVKPVNVRPGLRLLTIRVAGSYGAPRTFEAGTIDRMGTRRPFDASTVFVTRAPRWRLLASQIVGWLSIPADGVVTVLLLAGAFRGVLDIFAIVWSDWRRGLVGVVWLGAIVEAILFARPFANRLVLLDAGQDWLTYETYARDILLHGPLMTLGRPVGSAAGYYYQPLYPYFVALAHLVFGESLWGLFAVQRLLLTATVLLLWSIGELLFGAETGLVTLAIGAWFVALRMAALSSTLLTEALFIPLLLLWTIETCRLAWTPSRRVAFASGAAGGLATLARSTVLLAWPLVLVLLAFVCRRSRQRWALLSVMLAIGMAVVSTATLRNWIASRTFVPVTTSFGVNFFIGNPAPPELKDRPQIKWLDEHVKDKYVVLTLEYLRAAPQAFVAGLGKKAAYALGWFGALSTGPNRAPPEWPLIAVWVLAAAGLIVVQATGWSRAGDRGLVRAVPLLLAASQFAAVVLIFPNVYGDRLILPIYVLLVPYAAVALTALLTPIKRLTSRRSSEYLICLSLFVFFR